MQEKNDVSDYRLKTIQKIVDIVLNPNVSRSNYSENSNKYWQLTLVESEVKVTQKRDVGEIVAIHSTVSNLSAGPDDITQNEEYARRVALHQSATAKLCETALNALPEYLQQEAISQYFIDKAKKQIVSEHIHHHLKDE